MNTILVRGGQAAALAVATAGSWWGWMGWDHEYQTDPVTGVTSGPYEAWQVIGCALSIAVLAWLGSLLLPPYVVVPVMAVAFAIAFAVSAAADDPTGLWAVGAILAAFGTALGSAVVSVPTWYVRRHRAGRLAA